MMDGVGDIWSTGAFSLESPLKDLLDSGEYTTEQLLEQDELLQELRGMHPTLVQFFSQEEQVVKLIQHICKSPDEILVQAAAQEAAQKLSEEEKNEVPEDPPDDWEVSQRPAVPHNYSPTDVKVLRYPYVACEVICSEINSIIDTVVDGHVLLEDDDEAGAAGPITNDTTMILDLLFDVLYSTKKGALDDYRAGYLDKILAVLTRKRPQAMSTYMNEGGGKGRLVLMKATLQHLYSHSILQLTQRLLLPQPFYEGGQQGGGNNEQESWQNDENNMNNNDEDEENLFRSRWSESLEATEYLLASLVGGAAAAAKGETMDDDDDYLLLAESQNASEVLITMIQNSALSSSIMMRLTKDPHFGTIMDAASCNNDDDDDGFTPHDNRLTCAMNVLESIVLQLGGYGSVNTLVEDESKANNGSSANAECLLQHLPGVLERFNGLLRHESTKDWTSCMQFSKEPQPILGTSRLRIIRLIESLVLLGNAQVDELLCDSGILKICLDLFWEFEWNSMLHQSVANLLVHVFEGANDRAILQKYFVEDCNLLQRLVDSFEEEEEENPSPDDGVELQSNDADAGGDDSVLPVSDDDIDAALEQQEEDNVEEEEAVVTVTAPLAHDDDDDDPQSLQQEAAAATTTTLTSTRSLDLSVLKDMLSASCDAPSRLPSLGKGYMGHVIIVCQALVHACSTPNNNEGENQLPATPQDEEQPVMPEEEEEAEEECNNNLIIAKLISAHPLRIKWEDFVATTLASETAIQSTPLGGFHASVATIDPLHSHRPGPDLADFRDEDYDDDDDDDDDDDIGGDVIDMDDNDIEIAASMMDALSLPKRDFDSDFTGAGGGGGEYMFDDPLGGGEQFAAGGNDEGGGDDDSSDEEDETTRRASSGSDYDPPVMDLFAGNFAFDKGDSGGPMNGVSNNNNNDEQWSADFANFDSFEGAPAVEEDLFAMDASEESAGSHGSHNSSTPTADAAAAADTTDDVFVAAPHALLLDGLDEPPAPASPPKEEEEEEEDVPQTSQYSYRRRDSEDSSSDEEEADS